MIVRNEQAFLGDCLRSLDGRVDDIIVVDTGSTDGTLEIAKSAGVTLLHHHWQGDFSAARNVALDAVSTDWVLYIDADERLRLPHGGRLGEYIDPAAFGAYVRFRPHTGFTRYRELRLFRNDARLRFTGKIHETVVPAVFQLSAREGIGVAFTTAEIDHLGFDGDQSHKHGRNLPLLEVAVREDPDRTYYWYHLTETLAALHRFPEADAAAVQGIASAERNNSEKQQAGASLIFQFLARRAIEGEGDAFTWIDKGLAIIPDDHTLWFLKGRALFKAERFREALEVALQLQGVDADALNDGLLAFDRRIFEESACELAALCHLRLGQRREAGLQFAKAAKYAPADVGYRVRAAALAGFDGQPVAEG